MGYSGTQVSYGCCDTISSLLFPCSDDKNPREKKHYQVFYDQPGPVLPPRAELQPPPPTGKPHKRDRRAVGRTGRTGDMGWLDRNLFSGKRRTRRPQISGPFNFQHTGTGAVNGFEQSAPDLPRSAPPFRRLELSIYGSQDHVSPLLPSFLHGDSSVSTPQPARTRGVFDEDDDDDDDDGSTTLVHSRSYSSLSFHIPRRPVPDGSSFTTTTSNTGDSPPRIPPRARTRPRAYTSPSVEAIVERIASAIIERDILEHEIESVKERQSVCLSRPSTSYGPPDADPMPSMPVIPPSAPSFTERLSVDRPRTAPSTRSTFNSANTVYPPPQLHDRSRSIDDPAPQPSPSTPPRVPARPARPVPASAFNSHPPYRSPKIIDNSVDIDVPLAPPLPLILRPPLRKKKSFSRVSNWLFPAGVENQAQQPLSSSSSPQQHTRDMSLDSVTNVPRALRDSEGFYQCVMPAAPAHGGRRTSFDSVSSLSSLSSPRGPGSVYSTDEDYPGGGGTATATSNWSPVATPPERTMRQLGGEMERNNEKRHVHGSSSLSLGRTGTFGNQQRPANRVFPVQGPRPTSVGVAF